MSRRSASTAALLVALGILAGPLVVTVPDAAPGSAAAAPPISPPTTTTPASVGGPPSTIPATVPVVPDVLPLRVGSPLENGSRQVLTAAGAVVPIEGACATGGPTGSVRLSIAGDPTTMIDTAITDQDWSYRWTVPADPPGSLTVRAWCGDPSGYQGDYPNRLELEIVFVAQAPPPSAAPTTTAVGPRPASIRPAANPAPAALELPATS